MEHIRLKLISELQHSLHLNHPGNPTLLPKLLLFLTETRTASHLFEYMNARLLLTYKDAMHLLPPEICELMSPEELAYGLLPCKTVQKLCSQAIMTPPVSSNLRTSMEEQANSATSEAGESTREKSQKPQEPLTLPILAVLIGAIQHGLNPNV